MRLWLSCQLVVTNVHEPLVSEACGLAAARYTALSTTPHNAVRLLLLNQSWTVVTNRQVLHLGPTLVDSRLHSVIVPFQGLFDTSDVAG
jgi:hypothetical protein